MSAPILAQSYRGILVSKKLPTVAKIVSLQHVRHSKRFKAPPVGKEKQKWGTGSKYAEIEPLVRPMSQIVQERVPKDDVWIMEHYPQPTFSLTEAVTLHRELCMPDMFNQLDALILFHATLDMRTKKKTKFMSHLKKTVDVPHTFEDGSLNRIVAFCKTEEEITLAEKCGAAYAGASEIIQMFEKREILPGDFEHVVCTVDMLPEIGIIRKHLRESFPSKAKGTLGTDISVLVQTFMKGKTFESFKSSESVGHLIQPIARLNMSVDQIQENFDAFIDSISSSRHPSLGPTIMEGAVSCPPSEEKILLNKDCLTSIKDKVNHDSDDEDAEMTAKS